MNSFNNSDQMDFDRLANGIERIDSDIRKTNSIVQTEMGFTRNIMSRIKDGMTGIGGGIANAYRANKEDYGIDGKKFKSNLIGMVSGPVGAAINDIMQNAGISVSGMLKKSIGGALSKLHRHKASMNDFDDMDADIEELGGTSGPRSMSTGSTSGRNRRRSKSSHRNVNTTPAQERQIQQNKQNTDKILASISELKDVVEGKGKNRSAPSKNQEINGRGNIFNIQQSGNPGTVRNIETRIHSGQSNPVDMAALLCELIKEQKKISDSLNDPNAAKGGLFHTVLDMAKDMSGWNVLFHGRYANDIKRASNPLETITNALIKMYEWERIGIDLSRRQLNELIKLQGGQPQKYVGHESIATSVLKLGSQKIKDSYNKSALAKIPILGALGKTGLNLATFFTAFSEEDWKDNMSAKWFNALSRGKFTEKSNHHLNNEYNTRQFNDNVRGSDVQVGDVHKNRDRTIGSLSKSNAHAYQQIKNDPRLLEGVEIFNEINRRFPDGHPDRRKMIVAAKKELDRRIKIVENEYGINLPATFGSPVDNKKIAGSGFFKTGKSLFGKWFKPEANVDSAKKYTVDDVIQYKDEEKDSEKIKSHVGLSVGNSIVPVTLVNPNNNVISKIRSQVKTPQQTLTYTQSVLKGMDNITEILSNMSVGGGGLGGKSFDYEKLAVALDEEQNKDIDRDRSGKKTEEGEEQEFRDNIREGVEKIVELAAKGKLLSGEFSGKKPEENSGFFSGLLNFLKGAGGFALAHPFITLLGSTGLAKLLGGGLFRKGIEEGGNYDPDSKTLYGSTLRTTIEHPLQTLAAVKSLQGVLTGTASKLAILNEAIDGGINMYKGKFVEGVRDFGQIGLMWKSPITTAIIQAFEWAGLAEKDWAEENIKKRVTNWQTGQQYDIEFQSQSNLSRKDVENLATNLSLAVKELKMMRSAKNISTAASNVLRSESNGVLTATALEKILKENNVNFEKFTTKLLENHAKLTGNTLKPLQEALESAKVTETSAIKTLAEAQAKLADKEARYLAKLKKSSVPGASKFAKDATAKAASQFTNAKKALDDAKIAKNAATKAVETVGKKLGTATGNVANEAANATVRQGVRNIGKHVVGGVLNAADAIIAGKDAYSEFKEGDTVKGSLHATEAVLSGVACSMHIASMCTASTGILSPVAFVCECVAALCSLTTVGIDVKRDIDVKSNMTTLRRMFFDGAFWTTKNTYAIKAIVDDPQWTPNEKIAEAAKYFKEYWNIVGGVRVAAAKSALRNRTFKASSKDIIDLINNTLIKCGISRNSAEATNLYALLYLVWTQKNGKIVDVPEVKNLSGIEDVEFEKMKEAIENSNFLSVQQKTNLLAQITHQHNARDLYWSTHKDEIKKTRNLAKEYGATSHTGFWDNLLVSGNYDLETYIDNEIDSSESISVTDHIHNDVKFMNAVAKDKKMDGITDHKVRYKKYRAMYGTVMKDATKVMLNSSKNTQNAIKKFQLIIKQALEDKKYDSDAKKQCIKKYGTDVECYFANYEALIQIKSEYDKYNENLIKAGESRISFKKFCKLKNYSNILKHNVFKGKIAKEISIDDVIDDTLEKTIIKLMVFNTYHGRYLIRSNGKWEITTGDGSEVTYGWDLQRLRNWLCDDYLNYKYSDANLNETLNEKNTNLITNTNQVDANFETRLNPNDFVVDSIKINGGEEKLSENATQLVSHDVLQEAGFLDLQQVLENGTKDSQDSNHKATLRKALINAFGIKNEYETNSLGQTTRKKRWQDDVIHDILKTHGKEIEEKIRTSSDPESLASYIKQLYDEKLQEARSKGKDNVKELQTEIQKRYKIDPNVGGALQVTTDSEQAKKEEEQAKSEYEKRIAERKAGVRNGSSSKADQATAAQLKDLNIKQTSIFSELNQILNTTQPQIASDVSVITKTLTDYFNNKGVVAPTSKMARGGSIQVSDKPVYETSPNGQNILWGEAGKEARIGFNNGPLAGRTMFLPLNRRPGNMLDKIIKGTENELHLAKDGVLKPNDYGMKGPIDYISKQVANNLSGFKSSTEKFAEGGMTASDSRNLDSIKNAVVSTKTWLETNLSKKNLTDLWNTASKYITTDLPEKINPIVEQAGNMITKATEKVEKAVEDVGFGNPFTDDDDNLSIEDWELKHQQSMTPEGHAERFLKYASRKASEKTSEGMKAAKEYADKAWGYLKEKGENAPENLKKMYNSVSETVKPYLDKAGEIINLNEWTEEDEKRLQNKFKEKQKDIPDYNERARQLRNAPNQNEKFQEQLSKFYFDRYHGNPIDTTPVKDEIKKYSDVFGKVSGKVKSGYNGIVDFGKKLKDNFIEGEKWREGEKELEEHLEKNGGKYNLNPKTYSDAPEWLKIENDPFSPDIWGDELSKELKSTEQQMRAAGMAAAKGSQRSKTTVSKNPKEALKKIVDAVSDKIGTGTTDKLEQQKREADKNIPEQVKNAVDTISTGNTEHIINGIKLSDKDYKELERRWKLGKELEEVVKGKTKEERTKIFQDPKYQVDVANYVKNKDGYNTKSGSKKRVISHNDHEGNIYEYLNLIGGYNTEDINTLKEALDFEFSNTYNNINHNTNTTNNSKHSTASIQSAAGAAAAKSSITNNSTISNNVTQTAKNTSSVVNNDQTTQKNITTNQQQTQNIQNNERTTPAAVDNVGEKDNKKIMSTAEILKKKGNLTEKEKAKLKILEIAYLAGQKHLPQQYIDELLDEYDDKHGNREIIRMWSDNEWGSGVLETIAPTVENVNGNTIVRKRKASFSPLQIASDWGKKLANPIIGKDDVQIGEFKFQKGLWDNLSTVKNSVLNQINLKELIEHGAETYTDYKESKFTNKDSSKDIRSKYNDIFKSSVQKILDKSNLSYLEKQILLDKFYKNENIYTDIKKKYNESKETKEGSKILEAYRSQKENVAKNRESVYNTVLQQIKSQAENVTNDQLYKEFDVIRNGRVPYSGTSNAVDSINKLLYGNNTFTDSQKKEFGQELIKKFKKLREEKYDKFAESKEYSTIQQAYNNLTPQQKQQIDLEKQQLVKKYGFGTSYTQLKSSFDFANGGFVDGSNPISYISKEVAKNIQNKMAYGGVIGTTTNLFGSAMNGIKNISNTTFNNTSNILGSVSDAAGHIVGQAVVIPQQVMNSFSSGARQASLNSNAMKIINTTNSQQNSNEQIEKELKKSAQLISSSTVNVIKSTSQGGSMRAGDTIINNYNTDQLYRSIETVGLVK